MGTSTDGILFYGYTFDDESRYPWEQDEEEDEDRDESDRYAQTVGIEYPSEEYPDENDNSQEAIRIRHSYSAYWDKKRKAYEKVGITVGTHCSSECPMPYVSITASEITASRGYPEEVTSLEVKEDWDQRLKDFCKLMGIKVGNKKPRWWLVSYWG